MNVVACPSCGRESPAGFQFCGFCAAPLAPPPTAREERKRVSVLFCDLVGFTGRAERMDPEEVRALLQPYHTRVRQELERHGGTVEKFIGDAVVALFGAPTAHEDDPERAVRAALAIREAVTGDSGLQVRIGVTTGEALVALDARPESGEGMASGDVVNTAARLQSAAPVDGILVDETTHRATERAIEYREHEPVEAKGKAEPVPVWQAVAARSRLGLDVGERTGTPLVGRERELELLTGALNRARGEGVVQLVTLVGVPGIGKSRLVLELFRRVDEDPELIRWRQGRCLPYGEGVTLWALAEIVKAEAGVLETDSAEEAAAKLAAAVADAVGADGEGPWVAGHLQPLVGLGGEIELTGDRREEAFAAWRRFFEGVAEEGPFVAVFEDLQWADDTLLDFVDHLVDWATDVPLLVVAIARPELLARRPDWGGGKSNATTHSLAPLSDEQTAALVHAVLGRSVLPADAQRSLVENAGGNPLYAEEFARMLAERGGNGEAVPESVQGIIAARLDALEPEEKGLLQDAAVMGKVFWLGALAAVSGDERWRLERRLHELERRELVRRDRQSAVGGERQYAFRHLLVREVAYGQIPRGRRADKHAAVANWIETLSPDRSEDRAEMLAHHYLTALEYAEAAGQSTTELVGGARAALVEAADRALALNSARPAADFYAKALSLWPADEEPPPGLLLRHGRSLFPLGDDRAEEVLERARERFEASGDRENEAVASALIANLRWHRGDIVASNRYNERAVRLVSDLPPSEAKARVLSQVASAKMVAAEHDEAIRLGREAIAIAESLGVDEIVAHALDSIGTARGNKGDHAGGIADLERAVEIALALNSPEAVRALNNLASTLRDQGDLPRARAALKEGIRVGERFGSARIVRFLRGVEPIDDYFAGNWDEAIALADRFIAECETSPSYQEASVRAGRAFMRASRGDLDGALADVERALALARTMGEPQARAPSLGIAARVLAVAGDTSRARGAADELVTLTLEQPAARPVASLLAPIAGELGLTERVAAALGRQEPNDPPWLTAAREILSDRPLAAAEIYARMAQRPEEATARHLAATRLLREGRREEAVEQARRALAFWRSVDATVEARRTEVLLREASGEAGEAGRASAAST